MKTFLFGLAALSAPRVGTSAGANPVNKVIQLLTDLEWKVNAEGLEAHRVHEEFTAWCNTQSSALTFAVETGSKEKADLEASLVQLGATSESLQTKMSDLADSIATTEDDLKDATAIRAKEQVDSRKVRAGTLGCYRHFVEGDCNSRQGDERESVHDAMATGWKRGRGTQSRGSGVLH